MRSLLIFILVFGLFSELKAQEDINSRIQKLTPSARIAQMQNDLSISLARERTMTDEFKRCNDALSDKRRIVDLAERDAGKIRDELAVLRAKIASLEGVERDLKTELSVARGKNDVMGTVAMFVGAANVFCLIGLVVLLLLFYRKLWPKKSHMFQNSQAK